MFSTASRLHNNKSWAPATFRATVLFHEYDRRRKDNRLPNNIYKEDFAIDTINREEEQWEEDVRKQYLEERRWHEQEWAEISDEEDETEPSHPASHVRMLPSILNN